MALLLVVVGLLVAGCAPRPPLTPAEKQDEEDARHAICDFAPTDDYEVQICNSPLGTHEQVKKLRAHRAEKGTP